MKDRFIFRAWDKKENQMIELVGFAIPDFTKDGDGQLDFIGLQGGFGGTIKGKYKDFVLQQSTGLRDKNGQKIFEGDIIELNCVTTDQLTKERHSETKRFVVVYDCTGFGLQKIDDKEFIMSFGYNDKNGFLQKEEILGNIYEQPELIKT